MAKRRNKETVVGTGVRYFEFPNNHNHVLGYFDGKPYNKKSTIEEITIPCTTRR